MFTLLLLLLTTTVTSCTRNKNNLRLPTGRKAVWGEVRSEVPDREAEAQLSAQRILAVEASLRDLSARPVLVQHSPGHAGKALPVTRRPEKETDELKNKTNKTKQTRGARRS